MKIGISAFAWTTSLAPRHLDLLPKLSEQGFDGFEIPMFDPADTPARDLRRAMNVNDMESTVCAILPAGVNPISPDPAIRKRSREHLLRCIETAAETGSILIGGPLYAPIGYLPGRRRSQDEWDWAVEAFQGLGDSLDAHQMTLAIEPVNRSETFFLCRADETRDFCEAVRHPRVGVTIDTFHANIEEKSLESAITSTGKFLRHIHASENDRGLLGTGHVDFRGMITSLQQMGYDGYLMIEGFGFSPDEPNGLGRLWGDLNVSPEDIAFQGAKYLQNLLLAT